MLFRISLMPFNPFKGLIFHIHICNLVILIPQRLQQLHLPAMQLVNDPHRSNPKPPALQRSGIMADTGHPDVLTAFMPQAVLVKHILMLPQLLHEQRPVLGMHQLQIAPPGLLHKFLVGVAQVGQHKMADKIQRKSFVIENAHHTYRPILRQKPHNGLLMPFYQFSGAACHKIYIFFVIRRIRHMVTSFLSEYRTYALLYHTLFGPCNLLFYSSDRIFQK